MENEKVNIDEINDMMTPFLDNVVEVAKKHTEYKEKLGENHEYTKLACSLVKIFNQYQRIYVYIKKPEEYAQLLTECSNLAIEVLSYLPYEMMEGSFLKKRKKLKEEKKAREEKLLALNVKISKINEIIDADMKEEIK